MSTLPITLPGDIPGLLGVGAIVARKGSPWEGACVSDAYAVDTESPGIQIVQALGGTRTGVDIDLADLSLHLWRPAGMDRAARFLAEKVGLKCEATAPTFYLATNGETWMLAAGGRCVPFVGRQPQGFGGPSRFVVVPGISTISTPAEALRLAILTVWSRA